MNSMDQGKKYQVTYTVLRILACISVMTHHFINNLYGSFNPVEQKVFLVIDNFFMCNNGLFFMLSGKFALERYKGEPGQYYKNRLQKIVLPLFLVFIIYYLKDNTITFQISELWKFFQDFMNARYFWFMYALFGFYLVVPFFAPMFKRMNETEKNALFIILIAIMFWKNLSELFGFRFDMGGYPFFSYITFCFLGYLVDHMNVLEKREGLVYFIAGLCTLLSTYEAVFKSGWNPHIYDFSLTRISMCIGVFILVTRHTGWIADKMEKVILKIGSYTYFMLLLHGFPLDIVLKIFQNASMNHFLIFIIGSTLIFFGALVFAVLFQKILSLADRLLPRIPNKN